VQTTGRTDRTARPSTARGRKCERWPTLPLQLWTHAVAPMLALDELQLLAVTCHVLQPIVAARYATVAAQVLPRPHRLASWNPAEWRREQKAQSSSLATATAAVVVADGDNIAPAAAATATTTTTATTATTTTTTSKNGDEVTEAPRCQTYGNTKAEMFDGECRCVATPCMPVLKATVDTQRTIEKRHCASRCRANAINMCNASNYVRCVPRRLSPTEQLRFALTHIRTAYFDTLLRRVIRPGYSGRPDVRGFLEAGYVRRYLERIGVTPSTHIFTHCWHWLSPPVSTEAPGAPHPSSFLVRMP
jgi:hypothetical protein